MANNKYTALTAALETAKKVVKQYEKDEDGGTCNFDSPAIDYRAMGMQKSKAEEAIRAAGLRCYDWKLFGSGYLVICGIASGQGDRRTTMAEAAAKSLNDSGITAKMYYQMD